MKKTLLLLTVVLLWAVTVKARVDLCPVFSDNMVMQQMTSNAPIWGESEPGKTITVVTSWDNAKYTTEADSEGHWKTAVRTPSAGGPYTITISDGAAKTVLDNVMIGEVWICSGQSNMEMPVEGWGHVKDWQREKADADNYPNIRLLLASHVASSQLKDNLAVENGGWQECGAETVADFSACAYFFGRELHSSLGVPVGLIDTSWGGTIVEAWMSADAFDGVPGMEDNLRLGAQMPETEEDRHAFYVDRYNQWLKDLDRSDPGFADGRPVYAAADYDDSGWTACQMPYLGDMPGTINHMWWVRTTVDIPQEWEGRELLLSLGTIDDNDVTFFNGVPVGNTVTCVIDRNYTIPSELVKAGKASVAIRVHDTGGLSGITCDADGFCLSLKDGSERIPLAGEWRYKTVKRTGELPVQPSDINKFPNLHTVLYNSMINPIVPFAVKGAIWYQGEENASQAYQYRQMLPMMIDNWRRKWGYDFPFYVVQLANYLQRQSEPQESEWAELREAQLMTRLHMDKVGMATIIDIGDAGDIHPKNKQEVGRRLALCARATAYGENVGFEGPLYEGYRIRGEKIEVRFTPETSRGLTTSDGEAPKGFAVAGADHVWHWADARIEGGVVEVSSQEVRFPIAVRYAWADNPECNLTNDTGLPASPFRTDDWQGLTYGNRR